MYPSLRRYSAGLGQSSVLDSPVPIVHKVGVQPSHELLRRDAPPVPPAEELVLEATEEALAGSVIGAATLGRHAPDQAVLPADPHPLRSETVPPPARGPSR